MPLTNEQKEILKDTLLSCHKKMNFNQVCYPTIHKTRGEMFAYISGWMDHAFNTIPIATPLRDEAIQYILTIYANPQ